MATAAGLTGPGAIPGAVISASLVAISFLGTAEVTNIEVLAQNGNAARVEPDEFKGYVFVNPRVVEKYPFRVLMHVEHESVCRLMQN
jgi:hypothetical protein